MAAYRSPASNSRKSSSHLISVTAPSMASSSASISQPNSPAGGSGIGPDGASRTDQIIYRIYLKTVGVLVDGRLTHKGGEDRDRKKDKWFNIIIPDVDIHKSDLQVYKSISSCSAQGGTVPPLLIAFILDTSDIPNDQAMIWNRASGRSTLDLVKIGKGKGKEKEGRSGILLERWTFQASAAEYASSGSQTAPHTAYRMGIIHFRALYALLRTLPAYNLHRRLRRSNTGLRLGLKLWAPEGYPDTVAGLKEAWDVMEQDLISLDTGLDTLVTAEAVEPESEIKRYELPSLELFGNKYNLSVDYRPEVDIQVENLESVLSEQFVDMEEDWFTPTVARHRIAEGSNPSSVASSNPPSRRVSTPTTIPYSNPAPIPQRQGPASIGSFQSGLAPGSRSRQASSNSQKGTEVVSERWGAIGEGLPFATGTTIDTAKGSPLPIGTGAAVAARRLSGHSIHPFTSASPSNSNLRGSPSGLTQGPSPTLAPRPSIAHSSSIGRTSSFLSQSGRSFTHAQLAHMYTGSTSPPVTGDMSREHLPLGSSPSTTQPLVSPTSLSFSKQPLPRSVSGRQTSYTGSSPFIPSSLERESALPPLAGNPQMLKRHPSSLGTSQGQRARVSSYGSSAGGGEGDRASQNLLRRSSTRMSTESGLRHSLEGPDPQAVNIPDNDDIQSFLKTLEALPQPPSLAAQASRARIPSASSSLSNTSIPHSPSLLNSNLQTSTSTYAGRAPVTRAQVDDAVKRMTGSFMVNTKTLEQSNLIPPGNQVSPPTTRAPSVGLLSASRPVASARRVSPATLAQHASDISGISPSSVKRNSPLSGAPYTPAPANVAARQTDTNLQAVKTSLPLSPPIAPPPSSAIRSKSAARSLPAGPGLVGEPSGQGAPISGFLSPQPTGPIRLDNRSISSQRRGPVLLRGGFEGRSQSQSQSGQRQSTSPSRSPIRDYSRLGAVSGGVGSTRIGPAGNNESQAEAELIGWRRYRSEQRIRLRGEGEGIREGDGDGQEEHQALVRGPQGTVGVRRQSTGAGNVLGDPTSKGKAGGQGQQTAPSSLGRFSPE